MTSRTRDGYELRVGNFPGGALVRTGARLLVQGNIAGRVTVHDGGVLRVEGNASVVAHVHTGGVLHVVGNAILASSSVVSGRLRVSGALLVDPRALPAGVEVTAGTVFRIGGVMHVLCIDGALVRLGPGRHTLSIPAPAPVFTFAHAAGTFRLCP